MIVDETRTLSKGKSPVRISQIPNSTIPKFLPINLLVNAIVSSLWNLWLGHYLRSSQLESFRSWLYKSTSISALPIQENPA